MMTDVRPANEVTEDMSLVPREDGEDAKSNSQTSEVKSLLRKESVTNTKTTPRSSTPPVLGIAKEPAAPTTPIAVEPGESIDTPMVDISPGKGPVHGTSIKHGEPGILSLSRGVVTEYSADEPEMYLPDPQKIQIMDRFDNRKDDITQY